MSAGNRLALIILALFAPGIIRSQSLLDRPPNLSADWTGAPGTLYFHFVHRFSASAAPERKVTNVPTFLLGAGLPKRFLVGLNYSTNSTLAPRFPNEWELFARWSPLTEDNGSPIDVGGQLGYNNAAQGVDGELSLAKRIGIARLIGAGRMLSNPVEGGNVRYAIAGGLVLRVNTFVSLTGDVASLTNRDSSERVAWSAGIHFAIPMTPHTVSIQATNTLVETLQGVSRGTSDVRYGFEFTIPLTLRRYFGKRASADQSDSLRVALAATPAPQAVDSSSVPPITRSSPVPTPPTAGPIAPSAAPASSPAPTRTATPPAAKKVIRTGMRNINYLQPKIEITVGTTVEWTNRDPLGHTVTATNGSFNSGLVLPGKTFRHTFTKAGTYNFYCMPHPFMKGTIVVKDE